MRDEIYISTMRGRISLAHGLLYGGGALTLLSLLLWAALPDRPTLPPYLVTALLALAYGVFCEMRSRSLGKKS